MYLDIFNHKNLYIHKTFTNKTFIKLQVIKCYQIITFYVKYCEYK